MLVHYWQKRPLAPDNWVRELAAMGIDAPASREAVAGIIAAKGEAMVSCYQFQTPMGEPGSILVCHDLGRGVISWGTKAQWGHWDETYEILTLDESGEKYNFDGNPTYEGDDGSCSLGNF
jgi:hypothetical protein